MIRTTILYQALYCQIARNVRDFGVVIVPINDESAPHFLASSAAVLGRRGSCVSASKRPRSRATLLQKSVVGYEMPGKLFRLEASCISSNVMGKEQDGNKLLRPTIRQCRSMAILGISKASVNSLAFCTAVTLSGSLRPSGPLTARFSSAKRFLICTSSKVVEAMTDPPEAFFF